MTPLNLSKDLRNIEGGFDPITWTVIGTTIGAASLLIYAIDNRESIAEGFSDGFRWAYGN
ncbi:hypothetical protein LEM8419_02081 [Neolewinella maritima]|uniref:Class IIb bacteriocin, lactobin A/cerein 7B family n=1 Tax=Neolewinella maritima TaxID=1383882 RepID=A0ABM9B1H8_9BACT|nr:hypothetical protein [Neolewinella maritima]CAH1001178.1 hypothetical protein LEM8419_02081 [Neolewinella maritima]